MIDNFYNSWENQPFEDVETAIKTKMAEVAGSIPTVPTIPTNVSAFTNDAGYLTTHQDISGKANAADLAAVATTGSYNDLTNKPTIPTTTSQLTNNSGFITASDITPTDLSNYYTKAQTYSKSEVDSMIPQVMLWKGTQLEYDAIVTKDPNTFYIITG